MSMSQTKDWSHLFPEYAGKWIALKSDEVTVVASGKTLKTTIKTAKKLGFEDSALFKVPTKIFPYIGYV